MLRRKQDVRCMRFVIAQFADFHKLPSNAADLISAKSLRPSREIDSQSDQKFEDLLSHFVFLARILMKKKKQTFNQFRFQRIRLGWREVLRVALQKSPVQRGVTQRAPGFPKRQMQLSDANTPDRLQ